MKISRKYMIYTIIGILMLLATITAVSYAFMSTNQTQEESNIITTLDCMDISIKGTNDSLNLKMLIQLRIVKERVRFPTFLM